MRILALPGRLPETHARMTALALALGDEVEIRRYAAWPGDPVPHEAEEAAWAGAQDPDLVLAVSFGTLVAMRARADFGLSAKGYVFLGAPVRRLAAEGRLGLLADQARAAPTLFIQQAEDFTGPFRELAAALPAEADAREIEGADHVYDRTAALTQIILRWTGFPSG